MTDPPGERLAELPNGITLAYESFGEPGDPPLLLIQGLGMQMIGWPEEFCEQLAAEGFHVVRFDNRDVGHSTHLESVRAAGPAAAGHAPFRPRPVLAGRHGRRRRACCWTSWTWLPPTWWGSRSAG